MRRSIAATTITAVFLSLPMQAAHADKQCSWSSPGLTREEAYRSFAKSCNTQATKRTCAKDFERAEHEICKMTRSGQRLKPAPPCNYAELGVTREKARQTYFSGCETAPPDKRKACKAAWFTHEDEICQMIKQAVDSVLGVQR